MSQRMDYNAASPAGAKALGAVHAYVHQSGLPARLVNLVYLRVSQINGCAYCIDAHSRDLLKGGRTAGRASRPRLARSRRSLQRTGKGGARLGGSRHAPRRSRRFGRGIRSGVGSFQRGATCAELTIAIGLMNAYNRVGISFRATPLVSSSTADNSVLRREPRHDRLFVQCVER